MTTIGRLLIANRGEIACRIARTCRRLGVRAVMLFTDSDADTPHVRAAHEAVRVLSYLSIPEVVEAGRRAGVDALHPGFGFLAENPALARACREAGIRFVGPTPEAMEIMGSKTAARNLCLEVGIPVLPGVHGEDLSAAEALGFPLMVKAVAGGGGKGMRRVNDLGELREALGPARREAEKAFGCGDVFLEKALVSPRHIEVQLFGDQHGSVIHLGARECSIQRRHQKILEETPPPGLTAERLDAIAAAALKVGRAAGYTGAGTVEFLLAGESFYFLEMNTRLQVEHPVTEEVTGLDLVEWQLRVAEGARLPAQEEVPFTGHAFEARIYAEDPARGFLPSTGTVLAWRAPVAVRVESGVEPGSRVTGQYDPMVAKLVVRAENRTEALRRLERAVEGTVLLGVQSNLSFLRSLLADPDFRAGRCDIDTVERHPEWGERRVDDWALAAVAAADWLAGGADPWRSAGSSVDYVLELEDPAQSLEIRVRPDGSLCLGGHEVRVFPREDGLDLELDGIRRRIAVARQGDRWWVHTGLENQTVLARALFPEPGPEAGAGGALRAPLPGSVVDVLVQAGQRVEANQPLIRLEAMKMEHTISSAAAGTVEAIHYRRGDQVEADALLVTIRTLDGEAKFQDTFTS
ncbi:MAG: hypothetical protein HY319_14295 [Armatimonadetes bacterium]|nr:hypothetical protein [Armatimonadota bacterium]